VDDSRCELRTGRLRPASGAATDQSGDREVADVARLAGNHDLAVRLDRHGLGVVAVRPEVHRDLAALAEAAVERSVRGEASDCEGAAGPKGAVRSAGNDNLAVRLDGDCPKVVGLAGGETIEADRRPPARAERRVEVTVRIQADNREVLIAGTQDDRSGDDDL